MTIPLDLIVCWIFSVCGARLLAAIRAALVKGRSSGDPVYAAADDTTKELKERMVQLHQIQKQAANMDGTGISPARVRFIIILCEGCIQGRI